MLERNLSEERSKMTKVTLSIVAQAIGSASRISMANTLAHHTAYIKADTDVRGEMRAEYLTGYIMGVAKLSEAKAQVVLETPRAERDDAGQAAYYAATASFSYHIIRPVKGVAKGSGDIVEAAMRLVAKMTPAQKRKLTRLMAE